MLSSLLLRTLFVLFRAVLTWCGVTAHQCAACATTRGLCLSQLLRRLPSVPPLRTRAPSVQKRSATDSTERSLVADH